eukprot:7383617-Prymnesium_polylepis.1
MCRAQGQQERCERQVRSVVLREGEVDREELGGEQLDEGRSNGAHQREWPERRQHSPVPAGQRDEEVQKRGISR